MGDVRAVLKAASARSAARSDALGAVVGVRRCMGGCGEWRLPPRSRPRRIGLLQARRGALPGLKVLESGALGPANVVDDNGHPNRYVELGPASGHRSRISRCEIVSVRLE